MRIEEKILNEELDFDFTTAIDKIQNHISHLRLTGYSLNNIIKEQDRKIEALEIENSKNEEIIKRLKYILFDIEDWCDVHHWEDLDGALVNYDDLKDVFKKFKEELE